MPASETLAPAISGRAEHVPDRVDIGAVVARVGGWAITFALTVIFLWFGTLKFVPFEQQALVGIISNNPLISWLYGAFGVAGRAKFLGTFGLLTGLLIAGRAINPKLSVIGGAIGVWSFFLTLTCLFTTPGVIEKRYVGTPALSASTGLFLEGHRPVRELPVGSRHLAGSSARPQATRLMNRRTVRLLRLSLAEERP